MTSIAHTPRPTRHGGRGRGNHNLTTTQERDHITRVIAASPTYLQWLRDKVADVLEREAIRISERGDHEAAVLLVERSAGYRAGALPVW